VTNAARTATTYVSTTSQGRPASAESSRKPTPRPVSSRRAAASGTRTTLVTELEHLRAEVERLRAGINAITVHSRLQVIGTTQRGDVIEGRKWADILAVVEPLAAVSTEGDQP